MIVEVTQADIDGGERNSSTACPVVLALRRAGHVHAQVGFRQCWHDGDTTACNDLSKAVETFIERFDAGKPVKPFRFRTRRPS